MLIALRHRDGYALSGAARAPPQEKMTDFGRFRGCACSVRRPTLAICDEPGDHGMAKAPTSSKRAFSKPVLDQTFTIHSQNAQYVRLIGLLDQTLMRLDGLWLAGILSNKQRKDATHDLRRLVYGLGREIIDLERRARASLARAGKDEALQAAEAETDAQALVTGSLVDNDAGNVPDVAQEEQEGGRTDPSESVD
jgi:hypothetical protein